MPSPSMIAMHDEDREALEEQAFGTHETRHGGASLEKPFFYLAGPMSNLPKFNFPEFMRIAEILREKGYNICNPAEFEHEIARHVLSNKDGSSKKLQASLNAAGLESSTWADCLRRDVVYVGHENCAGVIVMPGWERSQGAQFETYVNYKFLRPLYAFVEAGEDITLVEIERRAALRAVGIED